ncbi:hypothetical protein VTK26DRAFT_9380 [Humicola hyalothermophila]
MERAAAAQPVYLNAYPGRMPRHASYRGSLTVVPLTHRAQHPSVFARVRLGASCASHVCPPALHIADEVANYLPCSDRTFCQHGWVALVASLCRSYWPLTSAS